MAIKLRALNNYSTGISLYAGSDSPTQGKRGIDVTAGDIVTIYCNGNSDYTFNGYKFIIDEGGGSFSVATPVETTPGATGSGWKKAYTIDSTIIEAVELAGHDLYAIPQIDDTQGTFYYFNRIDLSTTPSDIKGITEVLQGIAVYDSDNDEYTEYNLSNMFESQHKVLGNSLVYIQTVTQPIVDGAHAGDSVVFDSYGSAPAGITQPNLVFDDEEFDNTGYSYNNLPANTYINIGTPADGYSPQVILKYGSEPVTTTHEVKFYNGETLLKTVEVEDGSLFPTQELPDTPTRQGKEFYGWSSTSESYTNFDFLNTIITADTNLYAFFNNIVDLQYNGGHVEGSSATHKNVPTDPDTGKIIAEQMPTVVKSGYTLAYWVKDETTKYTPVELADVVFDANTTLTAQWELTKYTVTFKEGDETIATVQVLEGSTVQAIEPEHTTDESGKEFVYWMDENDAEFDFTTPITEDITLTAYYAQAGSSKWIMSLPNCFVGLKSDISELPIARVENGTKALAISESEGEETAYIFHKASLTWIELQKYTVII